MTWTTIVGSLWTEHVEAIVQRVAAVFACLTAVGWTIQFFPYAMESPVAYGCLAGTGALVVVLAAGMRLGRWVVVVCLLATVGGLALGRAWGLDLAAAPSNPGLVFLSFSVLVAATVQWSHRAWVALVPATYVVAFVVLAGEFRPAVDDVFATVPTGLIWSVLVIRLRASAVVADQRREAQCMEALAAVRLRAIARSMDEIRRLLHDELIAALSTIAHSRFVDEQGGMATYAAGRALAALTEAEASELGADLSGKSLRRAAALQGLRVHIEEGAGFDLAAVDLPAVIALHEATVEALRNVARHSGAAEATVRLTRTASGIRIDVEDHGVGLDDMAREGFGLSQSVRSRVVEVGGTVDIALNSAGGTTVSMHWHNRIAPAAHEPGHYEFTRDAGELMPFFTLVAVIGGAGQAWLAVRSAFEGSSYAELGVLVAALALHAAIAVHGSRGTWKARELVAVYLLLYVELGVGLWVAGAGALLTYDSWIVGLVTFSMVILGFSRDVVPTLLCGLIASAVVVGAAVIDPTIAPGDVVLGIVQPTIISMAGSLAAALVRRVGNAARRADRDVGIMLAAAELHRIRVAAVRDQLGLLTRSLEKFFAGVVNGTLPATHPDTRRRAQLLAWEARDDLYLPGVLDAASRQILHDARLLAGTVTLRADLDRVGSDLINQWVKTLAPVVGSRGQLTITAPPEMPLTAVLANHDCPISSESIDSAARRLDASVTQIEGRAVLTLAVRSAT